MIKKRIVATILISQGWAVQSFSYQRKLPLGDPCIIAENLARWKVDEIMVLDISATKFGTGIDFDLISRLAMVANGTPLIFGGGIKSVSDARKVIEQGADRIVVESGFLHREISASAVAECVGAQAVIISLPVLKSDNSWKIVDSSTGDFVTDEVVMDLATDEHIAEWMVTDITNEGSFNSFFKESIIDDPIFSGQNLICNGAVTDVETCQRLLLKENVSAIAIGNLLNHSELSYRTFKSVLAETSAGSVLRPNYD